MTTNSDCERYRDHVRTQLRHNSFVPPAREVALLEDGHKYFYLQPGEASWIFAGVARELSSDIESELDRRIDGVLKHFAGKKNRIDRKGFEAAVDIYALWVGEGLSRDQIKKKIKRKIADETYRIGRHGLLRPRRWFRKI